MVDPLDAILICEGVREAEDEQEYIEAWQILLDTGIIWNLQRSLQLHAIDLINEGLINRPVGR